MTGEMHKSEVTPENFPHHFRAIRNHKGAQVLPFDQYQGPYVHIPKLGRFWLVSEDGAVGSWYAQDADVMSDYFSLYSPGPGQITRAFNALVNRVKVKGE